MKQNFQREKFAHYFGVQIVAFCVLINGIILIVSTLISQLIRHDFRSTEFSVEVYLLIGLTLIYLANLLWRRKHTAWMFTLFVYAIYLINSLYRVNRGYRHHNSMLLSV